MCGRPPQRSRYRRHESVFRTESSGPESHRSHRQEAPPALGALTLGLVCARGRPGTRRLATCPDQDPAARAPGARGPGPGGGHRAVRLARGYAAEACAAALGWFAGALPGEQVVLCTQTANDRSMRLATKLGFTEVERFEEYGAEQWFGVWSSVTPSG
jgi:hypothetical protein